jgi:predicted membrane-bound spermidine synthase
MSGARRKVDLPQPVSIPLSKLYTVELFRDVARRVRPNGFMQSEKVEGSRGRALWCIARTLEDRTARPYLIGSLDFTLTSRAPFDPARPARPAPGLFSPAMMRGLFEIPGDLGPWPVEVNRLEDHALLRYYQ